MTEIELLVFLFVCYWVLRFLFRHFTTDQLAGCMVIGPWVIGLIGVIIVFFLDLLA